MRRSASAGFTLLEVLVALTILGLAVVTLIELSSQSLRLVKSSGEHQQAVLLADRLLSETQPTDEAVDTGQDGSFNWERRITLMPFPEVLTPPGKEPPKLFAVTVAVRWGANQTLELATLQTPAPDAVTVDQLNQAGARQTTPQGTAPYTQATDGSASRPDGRDRGRTGSEKK